MADSAHEQSYRNPFDAALDRWFRSFEVKTPPGVAHLSSHDQHVLKAVVKCWNGVLDPDVRGINHCAYTSYLVRNILRLAAGIDSEPVTVTADVTTVTGETLTLGERNPKVRRHPSGHQSWSGHEIIYIPTWSVALDLTIGQISSLRTNLADIVVDPAAAHLTQTPRRGTTFTAALHTWGVVPFGHAIYTVCRPNYSYRDAQGWAAQQNDLDQDITLVVERLAADGISAM